MWASLCFIHASFQTTLFCVINICCDRQHPPFSEWPTSDNECHTKLQGKGWFYSSFYSSSTAPALTTPLLPLLSFKTSIVENAAKERQTLSQYCQCSICWSDGWDKMSSLLRAKESWHFLLSEFSYSDKTYSFIKTFDTFPLVIVYPSIATLNCFITVYAILCIICHAWSISTFYSWK